MTEEAEPSDEATKDGESSSSVVGDAVAVIETKPMTALLTPAFTHLGQYLGQEVEERLARQNSKRLGMSKHMWTRSAPVLSQRSMT